MVEEHGHAPFPLEGGRVGDGGERTPAPVGPEDSVDRFARTPKVREGGILRARRLRAAPTRTEALLWKHLRRLEARFRRQAPIGSCVVDFACHSAKLVIEVDGGVHDVTDVALRDLKRDEWLASQGYSVLRIPTKRIENDIDVVMADITHLIGRALPPLPLEGEEAGGWGDRTLSPTAPGDSARFADRDFTPTQPSPLKGEG
jgi:very-short-patch-repair endonuclease